MPGTPASRRIRRSTPVHCGRDRVAEGDQQRVVAGRADFHRRLFHRQHGAHRRAVAAGNLQRQREKRVRAGLHARKIDPFQNQHIAAQQDAVRRVVFVPKRSTPRESIPTRFAPRAAMASAASADINVGGIVDHGSQRPELRVLNSRFSPAACSGSARAHRVALHLDDQGIPDEPLGRRSPLSDRRHRRSAGAHPRGSASAWSNQVEHVEGRTVRRSAGARHAHRRIPGVDKAPPSIVREMSIAGQGLRCWRCGQGFA